MKKIRTLICATAVAAAAASAFAIDAQVVSVSGKAEMQADGGAWTALSAGDVVPKGAVISTGFKSGAELAIGESVVTVGPLTRLTVEQLASGASKDEARLFLDTGSVSADVNKTDNKRVDFKVRSPAATASVRGTSFSFRSDGLLTTKKGLVSKGAAESRRPEVAADDSASSFEPEDGESSATTSTSAVSASYGIPVYEGQTSSTDAVSGQAISPQAERENSVSRLAGAPQSLSSQEGVSNSVSTPSAAAPQSAGGKSTGSIVVVLSVSD